MYGSFYGGKNGQSFKISEIFPNRVALDADLAKGYDSPIVLGSFVLISYGDKNASDGFETEYSKNFKIDNEAYGINYNNILYIKVYDDKIYTGGFGYEFISSLGGPAPQISIAETVPLDSESMPTVEIIPDESGLKNPDAPILQFSLPKTVKWHTGILLKDKPNQTIDNSQLDALKGEFYLNVRNGYLYRCALVVNTNATWEYLGSLIGPATQLKPTVAINPFDANGKVNNPSSELTFETDESGIEIPYLQFSLPKMPTFSAAMAELSGNNEDPNIDVNIATDNVNLTFRLRKASEWFYGGLVTADGQTNVVPNAKSGDYYLNNAVGNGDIYYLGTNNLWTKVGNIVGPLPNISIAAIYDERFHIDEKASINLENIGTAQNPKFNVPVGRSVKWHIGLEAEMSAVTLKSKSEDLFLTTDKGNLYRYNKETGYVKVGQILVPNLSNVVMQQTNPYDVVNNVPSAKAPLLNINTATSLIEPILNYTTPRIPAIKIEEEIVALEPLEKPYLEATYVDHSKVTSNYDLILKFAVPKGTVGPGLNIQPGVLDTPEQLNDVENPLEGMCFFVKTTDPQVNDLYIYREGIWIKIGSFFGSNIDDAKVSLTSTFSSKKIVGLLDWGTF